MNPLRFIKRLILWDFSRNSLPYEFVCIIYIASLVFLPTNSNGWFNDGEQVRLGDESTVTLHRMETTIYLTWAEGESEPDREALENFTGGRFGKGTTLIASSDLGPCSLRIVPGGWK